MTRRFRLLLGVALVTLIFGLASSTAISQAVEAAAPAPIPAQTHDFVDVPVAEQEWMEPFINAFYHQGVTGGCANPPLQYCPERGVTRAEMAVFFGRALGYQQAEDDNIQVEAYFKQTTADPNYHGVAGVSIDGYGVVAISDSGAAVFGLSDTGTGVIAQSTGDTGLYATGAGNLPSDTLYDIYLGGPLGEIFGPTVYAFSNGNINLDLDHNNDGANTFYIRNGVDAAVFTVDEAGNMYTAGDIQFNGSDIRSITQVRIRVDTNNNETNSLFQVLNSAGEMMFQAEENGNTAAGGTKSAIVDTVHFGTRKMYAVESAEVWFEDFGSARLVNGEVTIEIDPMFAETVNLSEAYHVYLTPMGGAEILYIEQKTPTSFTVRSNNRNSSIAFDYRLVAKRLGYEDVRMEEVGD